MAIGEWYFGDRGEARYAIGRWTWGGQLGSSYDGYLQQEARYNIGRWGGGGQFGSSYDSYLQEEARYAIKIKEQIAKKSVLLLQTCSMFNFCYNHQWKVKIICLKNLSRS